MCIQRRSQKFLTGGGGKTNLSLKKLMTFFPILDAQYRISTRILCIRKRAIALEKCHHQLLLTALLYSSEVTRCDADFPMNLTSRWIIIVPIEIWRHRIVKTRSNPVKLGQTGSHSVKPGQTRSNSVKLGQIRSNSVKLGHTRSNPVKPGQTRLNSVEPGQTRSNSVKHD